MSALSGYAQTTTPMTVPQKAVAQLEKIRKQTQAEVVVGKSVKGLPAETRPLLNKILLQSTADFLAIIAHNPTKEAYFQSLDASLMRILPLTPKIEERQQVAEYYQDLLDIVGLESSEGRLTSFVEAGPMIGKR